MLDATVLSGAEADAAATAWAAGHIPGSRHVRLDRDLSDAGSGLRYTLPPLARLRDALAHAGVTDGSRVVIYDAALNMWATRLWWMLRAAGFDAVQVLDGGQAAWVAAGLPLQVGPADLPPGNGPLTLRPAEGFVALDAIERGVAQAAGGALVCALPEAMFSGADPIYGRRGHIPGSLNLPAVSVLDTEGRFLPLAELRRVLAPLAGFSPLHLYCGAGISATLLGFALHLTGRRDVAVFDGSLEEWGADPARPLAVTG